MKISETIPQLPTFKLNSKEYTLKLLNMDDFSYFEEKYGSLESLIEHLTADGKFKSKCEIIYSQLVEKEDFPEKEVEEFDRMGKKQKFVKSGPVVFMENISLLTISEPIGAFLKAVELSTPKPTGEVGKKKQPKRVK